MSLSQQINTICVCVCACRSIYEKSCLRDERTPETMYTDTANVNKRESFLNSFLFW